MKVQLIRYTPDGEKLIASCAKLCYSKSGIDEIENNLTDERVYSFIAQLNEMHHESPLEHISFTFAIEGVSRVLTHQLVRHRIASYSQQSQRYVKFDDFEYIIPPAINEDDEAKNIFVHQMNSAMEAYEKITEILMKKHRVAGQQKGVEKVAIEDARYVFPNAAATKIVVTMNARTLIHFFKHRCCRRAQWEIRELATQMLILVKEVYPSLFKGQGPSCLHGSCPEGKMTCGKQTEVKEYFKTLDHRRGENNE